MVITTYAKGKAIYANASKSKRVGKKVVKEEQISLGRVVDLEKHIFQNRKYGVYEYDPETGSIRKLEAERKKPLSFRCIDFGDSFFLSEVMKSLRIDEAIDSLEGIDHESLKALVLFYLECQVPNASAEDWYEGNYASVLYPDARMDGQRISELLRAIGTEEMKSSFLKAYYSNETFGEGTKVIIDSTGIINNVHCQFTTICNHNGKVSTCLRLITVIREDDSKPVYFRMIPGASLDSATLKKTLLELGKYGIKVSLALLDAGYCTLQNLKRLTTMDIDFITRLDAKMKAYKELKKKYFGGLEAKENFIRYGERYFYMKPVENVMIENQRLFAYVCIDCTSKAYDLIRMGERKKAPESGKAYDEMQSDGFFILISRTKHAREDILPKYYLRQKIEQSYDLVKNETNIQPIRNHSEETINGHLLVSFISQIVSQEIQNRFKDENISQERLLLALRNQKAEAYPSEVLPLETKRIATLAYKKMKITCPETIKIPMKKRCR